MDPRRFDEVARTLARHTTRRALLATALALPFAGRSALARPNGHRVVCRPLGVGCTRNDQCCSLRCETDRRAPRNIRNRCGCPERTISCNGACIDRDDPENCGRCGNVCDFAENCISGICTCGYETVCDAGDTCCMGEGAFCTDLATSPWSCGQCGFACSPDVACVGGVCQEPCGNRCTEQETCKDDVCLCNGVLCREDYFCFSAMCMCAWEAGPVVCETGEVCRNRECVSLDATS